MESNTKETKTSLATKTRLANSLRELMTKKKFSKITISMLVESSGMNRKTFYYHFKNLSDLLSWTFQNEAMQMFETFDFVNDYERAINFAMDYIEKNREIIKSMAGSIGRSEVRRFIYNAIHGAVVLQMAKLNPDETEEFRKISAEFYTEGFVGMLLRWVDNPMNYNRAELVEYFKSLFRQNAAARSN